MSSQCENQEVRSGTALTRKHALIAFPKTARPHLLPTNIFFRDQVRWLRRAAHRHGIEVIIDLESMCAFLRKGDAHATLRPHFLAHVDGQVRYVGAFIDEAIQFTGWRPVQADVVWPASTDKLVFKRAAAKLGITVPDYWLEGDQALTDVIVKRAVGSFGEQVHGPYRSSAERPLRIELGEYYERFISGDLLKVWYWGSRAVGLECDPMPVVVGDGASSIRELVLRRAQGPILTEARIAKLLERCATVLAFDGASLADVLPAGQRQRVEFRYGSDVMSQRERVLVDLRGQVDSQWQPLVEIAPLLQRMIPDRLHERVLYAVDAVRDAEGRIFVLEMNSNPFVNPLAYEPMLASWLEQQGVASAADVS